MGVNAAGLGVCVNSLPQLPSAGEGVPVAFVLRRLLQARGLAEAADLVQSLPHATNQHYLLAAPDGVRSFEAGAAGVAEYRPPDAARLFHTNHPLTDIDQAPETEAARENSVTRLGSLTARLAEGPAGLAEIEAALSSTDDPRHPVCRAPGHNAMTTGSMISRLEGGSVRAWASAGPPRERGYHAYELEAASALV
jgi:hypothetical protein